MPNGDGYSLISKVRNREAETGRKMIPAIAVTGAATDKERIRALKAGYQMHISKPIDLDKLVQVVASFTGRSGAR